MGTKVGFSKALRTLSDIADALVASGALTEMTGSEFVAYAASQLALASTEPRDQAAARIAAVKAAINTAQEQFRGGQVSGDDVVVFVKVYDSDEAVMAGIEAGVASCKAALSALRLPCQEQLSALTQDLGGEVRREAVATSEARVVQASSRRPAPPARNFHDDDPDADDWLSENEQPSGDWDGEEEDLVDDAADEDDLDEYMKSIGGSTTVAAPRAKSPGRTAARTPAPAPAPTRVRQASTRAPKIPKQAPPKKIPMPRPMSPADVARAVREGHGEKGGARLTTNRSSLRG